jgi:hypothetical protein
MGEYSLPVPIRYAAVFVEPGMITNSPGWVFSPLLEADVLP